MSKTGTRRYWVRTDQVLEGQEKEWRTAKGTVDMRSKVR